MAPRPPVTMNAASGVSSRSTSLVNRALTFAFDEHGIVFEEGVDLLAQEISAGLRAYKGPRG